MTFGRALTFCRGVRKVDIMNIFMMINKVVARKKMMINKNTTRKKVIYILALIVLLAAVVHTVPDTFGQFVQSVKMKDAAFVAKFDIAVTAPDELDSILINEKYQHYFPMTGDQVFFTFNIRNNSEVFVLCRPYINNGIAYHIIVGDELKSEFTVGIGESVDFQLVIMSEGLSVKITEANLFVDIKQL